MRSAPCSNTATTGYVISIGAAAGTQRTWPRRGRRKTAAGCASAVVLPSTPQSKPAGFPRLRSKQETATHPLRDDPFFAAGGWTSCVQGSQVRLSVVAHVDEEKASAKLTLVRNADDRQL